jgi:glycine dehydrogenase subunit 1
LQKSHYLADELCKVAGVKLAFGRPFFKEFSLKLSGDPGPVLEKLRQAGYLAGLPLGQWYRAHEKCVTIAVTEKRTRRELDGLVGAWRAAM